MNTTKEKIEVLLKKYGELKFIGEDEQFRYYRFLCDISKIYDNDNESYPLASIELAIICNQFNECNMYCFKVGVNDTEKNDILRIINEVNRRLEYGKYTLDSDNEIDWEYRFDIEHIDADEIRTILKSFLDSILLFVVLKRKLIHQRINKTNET